MVSLSPLLDSLKIFWEIRKLELQSEYTNNRKELVDGFVKKDQKYRSLYPEEEKYNLPDSVLINNDIQLQKDLFTYIELNGWPEYTSELLTTILLHLTKAHFEKFRGLIFEQVKKGKLDPYWFASMVDRKGNISWRW